MTFKGIKQCFSMLLFVLLPCAQRRQDASHRCVDFMQSALELGKMPPGEAGICAETVEQACPTGPRMGSDIRRHPYTALIVGRAIGEVVRRVGFEESDLGKQRLAAVSLA